MASQHFQTDETTSNHCKSMTLWLVLSYPPCAFRSSHGYTDLCHIAGFIPLPLVIEILFLLKIFLSMVAPSSFHRVFFGATPLWRSSHPTAMRLPLFLVELRSLPSSLWHPGIPAQGLPQASHCVGLCTAARDPRSICCGWFSQPLEWIILLLPACQRNQLESWARELCWERPARSGSKLQLSKINQRVHQLDNTGAGL